MNPTVRKLNVIRLKLIVLLNRLTWRVRAPITGIVYEKVVVIDHLRIRDATLRFCAIVYGGGPLRISDTKMEGCVYHVFGKATNVLTWLRSLEEAGATDMIARTFPKTMSVQRAAALEEMIVRACSTHGLYPAVGKQCCPKCNEIGLRRVK